MLLGREVRLRPTTVLAFFGDALLASDERSANESFLLSLSSPRHSKPDFEPSQLATSVAVGDAAYRKFINGAEACRLCYVRQLFHELYVHIYTCTIHGGRIIEAGRSNSYVKDFLWVRNFCTAANVPVRNRYRRYDGDDAAGSEQGRLHIIMLMHAMPNASS